MGSGWAPGSVIEIGSETMLVTSVDISNKIATVVRGWLESTTASHSANDAIFINPRILRSDVLDLVNDCLHDMFAVGGLFSVGSVEIAYDGGLIGYNLPDDLVQIIRVDGLKDTSSAFWEPIYDWLEIDNADSGDFASGKAIMMRASLPPGAFRVIYAKAFTQLADESEALDDDAGLRPYMFDLPFYYAMNRLMVDEERKRSQIDAAENHQRAQDVPPFLALRTGEWYQARYAERLKAARAHQMKELKPSRGTGYGS